MRKREAGSVQMARGHRSLRQLHPHQLRPVQSLDAAADPPAVHPVFRLGGLRDSRLLEENGEADREQGALGGPAGRLLRGPPGHGVFLRTGRGGDRAVPAVTGTSLFKEN